MIIDAHVHLPTATGGRTFAESRSQLLRDMSRHGVSGAIVIADNIPGSTIGDVETCLNLLGRDGNIALLGAIDVRTEGRARLDWLDGLLQTGRLRGIKLFPGHDPIYPTDERLMPVYELCRKRGLPVMIHTGWNSHDPEPAKYNDPKYIVEVAKGFPGLQIVLSHYFWPRVEYCYEITQEAPNIYFDTSGLADEQVVRESGPATIRDVLLRTIRERPGHVLFGSDYAMCDWAAHIRLIQSFDIAAGEREDIFWRRAAALFKLPWRPEGIIPHSVMRTRHGCDGRRLPGGR